MTTTHNRNALLKSIADTILDYRVDECPKPTPRHVNRWIEQFNDDVQLPMLAELDHVFKQTYLPKARFNKFFSLVVRSNKLTKGDPYAFWKKTNFMDIQQNGNSQMEMLVAFDKVLQDEVGLSIQDCGSKSGTYLYLDDGIFTGNHIKNDISEWIREDAPSKAKVHIVVIAKHSHGYYYVLKHRRHRISNVSNECDKKITFQLRGAIPLENQPWCEVDPINRTGG